MVKMVVVKLVWGWDSNHTSSVECLVDGFACVPERGASTHSYHTY